MAAPILEPRMEAAVILTVLVISAGHSEWRLNPRVDLPPVTVMVRGGETVRVYARARLGDFNDDGRVSGADYLVYSLNHGRVGALPQQGDANGDGQVTGADYLVLSAHMGQRITYVQTSMHRPGAGTMHHASGRWTYRGGDWQVMWGGGRTSPHRGDGRMALYCGDNVRYYYVPVSFIVTRPADIDSPVDPPAGTAQVASE
jgi:hypothetical protein